MNENIITVAKQLGRSFTRVAKDTYTAAKQMKFYTPAAIGAAIGAVGGAGASWYNNGWADPRAAMRGAMWGGLGGLAVGAGMAARNTPGFGRLTQMARRAGRVGMGEGRSVINEGIGEGRRAIEGAWDYGMTRWGNGTPSAAIGWNSPVANRVGPMMTGRASMAVGSDMSAMVGASGLRGRQMNWAGGPPMQGPGVGGFGARSNVWG